MVIEETAWRAFSWCFHSMWICTNEGKQMDWLTAFDRYVVKWSWSWDAKWMRAQAREGRFFIRTLSDPTQISELISILAFVQLPKSISLRFLEKELCVNPLILPSGMALERIMKIMVAKTVNLQSGWIQEFWHEGQDKMLLVNCLIMKAALVSVIFSKELEKVPRKFELIVSPHRKLPNPYRRWNREFPTPLQLCLQVPQGKEKRDQNPQRKMKVLHWNVRGVVGGNFKALFRGLMEDNRPDIVLLSETKVSGSKGKYILANLGFSGMLAVDAVGNAGGLVLLWNAEDFGITVMKSSSQSIHAIIQGASE